MHLRFSLLLITLLIPCFGYSAVVRETKGTTAIIDLEDIKPSIGQRFYAIDADGKKKALLEIIKTKDTRALAKILKGAAQIGYEVVAVDSGPSNIKLDSGTKAISGGIILGYSMDSMTITVSNISSELAGSNVNYGGFIQYSVSKTLDLRAVLGFKNFVVKKDTGTVDIKFFDGELWGKYNFTQGKNLIWAGGALGVLIPTTVSSNVIANDSISVTSNVILGVGDDFIIKKGLYITGYLDYRKILFSGSEVSASSIDINAGVGFHF